MSNDKVPLHWSVCPSPTDAGSPLWSKENVKALVVQEGVSLVLPCRPPAGLPPPIIFWMDNSEHIITHCHWLCWFSREPRSLRISWICVLDVSPLEESPSVFFSINLLLSHHFCYLYYSTLKTWIWTPATTACCVCDGELGAYGKCVLEASNSLIAKTTYLLLVHQNYKKLVPLVEYIYSSAEESCVI